ncbi:MAG TPA: nitroreductase family protein [Anaerolineaceae bacterium]|nr:nitroreductase family protein [Anaerolineaceae bacterium]
MPLEFGRGGGAAQITIDRERCTVCGLCVQVCSGAPLLIADGVVCVDQSRLFGCIGCGQCVAVCPQGCISVTGRDLSPDDYLELPPQTARADFDHLYALLLARRSSRNFQDREVEAKLVERILTAASTAPMGLPPSEVGVLVLPTRQKVKAFRDDLLQVVRPWRKWLTPFTLGLLRPFIGKDNYDGFKQFILPALTAYVEQDDAGTDWFFYDAPLALYFYGSRFADPADVYIAATYAMVAGQALGLGTCMLGFTGYIMQYSARTRQKYHLPKKIQPGLAVIFGYPAVKYRQALRRRFADVRFT